MSRKKIKDVVKHRLWSRSGGRCAICNDYLMRDDLSFANMNNAHIAHIFDVNKKTHRFSDEYSEDQKNEEWNLILLCQKHHRLIDNEMETDYSVDKLFDFKKKHEQRIFYLTSIKESVKTNIIFYFSKIGTFQPNASFEEIKNLLTFKNLYPSSEPIEIGSRNSAIEDNEELYWQMETKTLELDFERKIVALFDNNPIKHFSLFALAPQPLLIKLGTLIPDLYSVDVYQKHREPDTWEWQDSHVENYKIIKPKTQTGIPILNISLSATINNTRITSLFDDECSIWTLTIDKPNNNFLKSQKSLVEFRNIIRELFDDIKYHCGHDKVLNVFPAMPNSASIEFGRIWMPKSDMNLEIYDERDGFNKALKINRI